MNRRDKLTERHFLQCVENLIDECVENVVLGVESENNQIGFGVFQNDGVQNNNDDVIFEWKEVSRSKLLKSHRFKRETQKINYEIKHNFGSFRDLFQIEANIDELFEQFIRAQIEKANDYDLISVGIEHSELVGKLFIPPARKIHLNREEFFNSIYEIAQSNKAFILAGKMTMEINITKGISGEGRKKSLPPKTIFVHKKNSKNTIIIKNRNNACGFHAIAVCIAHHEIKKDKRLWQDVRRDTNKEQTNRAIQIAQICGLPYNKALSDRNFKDVQSKLKEYQLTVIDANNKKNRLFVGQPILPKKIYIEYEATENTNGHFNSIINIKRYMGQGYYCEHCHTPYSHKYTHSCEYICENCKSFPRCQTSTIKIECQDCGVLFESQICYERHRDNNNDICNSRKICKTCLELIKEIPHICNNRQCGQCGEIYNIGKHYCCLKPYNLALMSEEDRENKIIVTYDIESQQNELSDGTFIHKPDLLISMTVCNSCWNEETQTRTEGDCLICGKYINIFQGIKCIKKFGDYIYINIANKASDNNCFIYAFAHNAKGYDNHFILSDLFQRGFMNTEVIMNGNKVLRASVGNIKFLDSLLMFQQPLSALPKAFGFENIVRKGFFPHNFHNKETFNYIGDIPDKEYFGIKFMKKRQLKDFNSWYQKEIDKQKLYYQNSNNRDYFNLKKEMISYCENDVLILLLCIQNFRKIFKGVTSIDPITRCFTLASMGLEIFKAKILPPNTIGVTPLKGYSKGGSFSKIGCCWLDYQQKLLNTEISREVKIDKFIVDGYSEEKNKIFEYNGCYFHCHTCLYKDERNEKFIGKESPQPIKSPNEIYEKTVRRRLHFIKRGFDYTEEWDCSLKRLRKEEKTVDRYIKDRMNFYTLIEKYGGVSVRESFFGGRTNNIKFICDVTNNEDERILYYDFRSLYPTVLKYEEFPIGHPKVLNEDLENIDLSNIFGFIKCIILPPNNLYIPVLPMRSKKKLLFALCQKCADERNQNNCDHNESERALIGTWTSVEINNALNHGYKIIKLIEIYNYTEKTKNIFSAYIDLWLKYKQQADGWPSWVKSNDDKIKYIEGFFKNEGIKLEYEEIEKNPGLRTIAKLFLNTLWGKLAQKPNLPQTSVCNEYKDYIEIASDVDKKIKGELMINENCLLVEWEYVDDNMSKQNNTSLAVASFVTSYARTRLMKVIDEVEKVPGRLLYMDTDSIIFKYKDGEDKPETDDYLGCLADEITKDYGANAKCTKFCSLGPKVYAMEIWPEGEIEPIVPIKAKGITLTEKALDLINMENMIKLAEEYIKTNGKNDDEKYLNIPQMQIYSDKMHTVYTKNFQKLFRAMSEKRRIKGNFTLPYGFIE